jgi:hypothetical protein
VVRELDIVHGSCIHESYFQAGWLLQSAHGKDWSWANICPVAAFGADCLIDQAGVVDEMLLKPIELGNILDYGADPSGKCSHRAAMLDHLN